MKFATYIESGTEKVGILTRDNTGVIDLKEVLKIDSHFNMQYIIENYCTEYDELIKRAIDSAIPVSLEEVTLLAPIREPKRGIICLGKNYKEHVKEVPSNIDFKNGIPENPIYFSKLVNECVGDKGTIFLHSDISSQVDYEAELGVIIGKEGKDILIEEVEDYIFGYTIINDISFRDLQSKHVQWFRGKSLDNSCPMGPYIVSKDELKFPLELDIKCSVNGESRQSSNTKVMIFDIPYIISEFSKGLTLKKGDIISTGTPAGVGIGFNPKKFLKENDVVISEIEGIGTLTNIVKLA